MSQPGEWPPQPGLHLAEWSCELLGTALLLLGGLSAVCLDFGPHSPLRGLASSFRLLLTGLLFAGTGSLLAISPLGRRSGAHLNPVVTLAFWTQRKVHPHDLAGYVGAQLLGAVLGTAAVAGLWGGEARAVHLGATAPRARSDGSGGHARGGRDDRRLGLGAAADDQQRPYRSVDRAGPVKPSAVANSC